MISETRATLGRDRQRARSCGDHAPLDGKFVQAFRHKR